MIRFFVCGILVLYSIIEDAKGQSLMSNRSITFKALKKSLIIENDGSVTPSSFVYLWYWIKKSLTR